MTLQLAKSPPGNLIQKIKAHHQVLKLMGCRFVLTAVHENPQIAWDAIRVGIAEIQRIEALISSWRDDSQTGLINQNAGVKPVEVNKELFDLIKRCQHLSHITRGAFDISGTLSRYYWNFDGQESKMLSRERIEELRDLINYNRIILDEENQTVFLQKKGMKIGFGGIGKGYAALRAKMIMQKTGVKNGLVNAAGDLMAWGNPPNRKGWEIKIPDPEDRDKVLAQFDIPFGSVVTSGEYEKYALIDGKRYSHIVDPRTGLPVAGLKSVTVISPNPELADALATGISVLGEEKGLTLVNRLKGVECLTVNFDNKIRTSDGLNL